MARRSKPKKARKSSARVDRDLRLVIFRHYANSDIAPDKHVEAMHHIFVWLKTGRTPSGIEHQKPKLVPFQQATN